MADILIVDAADQIKSEFSAERASVQYAENEMQALNKSAGSSSAIILLHYEARKKQTPEYIKQLNSVSQSKVVVIAQALSDKDILACLLAGAQGYIKIKDLGRYSERLLSAISKGEAWISRRMTTELLNILRSA